MNSGSPGSKCGGMKGGWGLINVYRSSATKKKKKKKTLSPNPSGLIPLLNYSFHCSSNQPLGLYLAECPVCYSDPKHFQQKLVQKEGKNEIFSLYPIHIFRT